MASLFLVGFSPVVASPFIHAQESTTQESTGEVATEGNLIVEYIKADAKEIKGTAPAGATITVLNERTSDKETVDADKEGKFETKLPESGELTSGDQLHLTSLSKDIQTLDYIEVTVK